jgi:hypothetical protein
VPQIVESEAGHSDLVACTVERLTHGVAAHRSAAAADEYAVGACPGAHVLSEEGQDVRRRWHQSGGRTSMRTVQYSL